MEDEDFTLMEKLVHFPQDRLFPILDIFRLLILDVASHNAFVSLIGSDWNGGINRLGLNEIFFQAHCQKE